MTTDNILAHAPSPLEDKWLGASTRSTNLLFTPHPSVPTLKYDRWVALYHESTRLSRELGVSREDVAQSLLRVLDRKGDAPWLPPSR